MWSLVRALDAEWKLQARGVTAALARQRWADDPVLGSLGGVDEILHALRQGAADPAGTDRVLAALVNRAATDDVALRVTLQALLPGLVNIAKRVARGAVDDELEAEMVTEAVARIRHYPLARRPKAVAANIVLDVLGHLTRRRTRRVRVGVVAPDVRERDPSDEVRELVTDAVASGRLRPVDGELLLGIAVGRDTISSRAAREGISYAALDERWRRARDRLRRAVASDGA